jgi:hypothetical protein
MINIGIGVSWAKSLYSVANNIIANFRARVLSYPNSIFEAGPCLDATLEELNAVGLLDDASLIVTPNAYNEGVLYDVIPNTTLGDMDVVRATTATRVNSLGLIEVVPRNLLTYSEDFSNVSWTKARGSITSNVTTAPNGTLTADKFIPDTQINPHFISEDASGITIGNLYNLSVYAKISEWNTVALFKTDSTIGVSFRLDTQTSNIIIGTPTSYSITSVGNGWFRLSVSFPATSASDGIQIRVGNNSLYSIAGNNLDGLFLWGAQLNEGSTATEYFPTTTRLNIPRIDYTNGSCPSLLVEPQRTNLLTYSNDYADASWGKAGVTVTLGTQVNPQGIASTYSISNTTLGDSYLQKTGLPTTAGNYTMSVFVKNIDNVVSTRLMAVHLTQGSVTSEFTYTWATNTFVLSGTNAISGSSILFSNGWVRLTFTYSIGAGVVNHWNRLYANQVLTVTKSALVYGFQCESGNYPTSYIPTVASTVTRNADVISKTGISSLIGQTEGTLFFNGKINSNTLAARNIVISDGTAANRISLSFGNNGANRIDATLISASVSQVIDLFSIRDMTVEFKIAFTYSTNNFRLFIDGIKIAEDLLGSTYTGTTLNQLNFSSFNNTQILDGSVKSVQLYKTALTDEQCTLLTGDLYDSYAEMANSLNYILE